MSTVTGLGFSIFSRYDGSGVNRANRSINGLQRNMEKASSGVNTLSGRISLLAIAATSLGPALVPLAGAVVGLGAALAATAVTAGSAAAIYGAALKGAIQRTLDMAAAGKKLTPTQVEFVKAVKGMRTAWKQFIDATSNKTLQPATLVVQGLIAGIRRLIPVINAVHPIAMRVAQDFKGWMQGEGLKRFINIIIKFGVPALESLRRVGVNVLATLGFAFRAALPLIKPLTDALVKGSAALRNWAASGGFTRFIAKIMAQGPAVSAFFTALVGAIRKLASFLIQSAPAALRLATVLLNLVANLSPAQIMAIANAFVLWKSPLVWMFLNVPGLAQAFSAIMRALPPGAIIAIAAAFAVLRGVLLGLMIVTKIATAWAALVKIAKALRTAFFALRGAWMILSLAFAATPLGWIVIAIGALVAAFVILWLKVAAFRHFWQAVWRGVQAVASAVWGWLKRNWKLLLTVFLLALGPAGWFFAVLLNWRKVWNGVRRVASGVWGFLKGAWKGFIRIFVTGPIRTFGKVWSKVWNGVRGVVERVWKTISGIVKKIIGAIKKVKDAIGGIVGKAGKGIKGVIGKVGGFLGGLFASGGPVRGPGNGTSDSIVARLSTGEHVWTAREVAAAGGHGAVMGLRRIALGGRKVSGLPRFASGGAVGAASGAGTAAPSAAGVREAKSATQDSISSVIAPVAALFRSGLPAAASAMQTAVSQNWQHMRAAIAIQATSAVGSVSGLVKSWKGVALQTAQTAIATTQGTGRMAAGWALAKAGVAKTAATMAGAAFRPVQNWHRVVLPGAANSMQQQVRTRWHQATNGIVASGRAMTAAAFRPMQNWQNRYLPIAANVLQSRVRTRWTQAMRGVQGSHRALVSSVYNPTRDMYTKRVPGWANSMKNAVVRSFGHMRDGVRNAWSGIRGATKDPVNWVITNTYGRGIRALWNAVSNVIFGKGKRQLPGIKRLAGGGPVRGPGTGTSDSIPAMLSSGEHVWTAREVRAAGGHHAVAKMRSGVSGRRARVFGSTHFAEGGAPGADSLMRGSLLPWIGSRMDPVRATLDRTLGKTVAFRDMVRTAMQMKITDILDFVAKDDAANMPVAGGFSPFRPWRAGDGRHVGFRGVTLNVRSRDMMLKAEGLAKKRFQYFQGSWSHAAASAGTHSGGGAVDIGPAVDPNVGFMRASGWAAWRRTPAEGFSPHIHGIAVGDPTVSPGAAAQVRAFFNGRNGLANNGPDTFMGGIGAGGAKAYARAYMKVMGWSDSMWPALAALWQRESGWNARAKNPSSGAYGIPQALPASKMGSEGRDYLTNAATQIRWGEKYIRGRYGNPVAANNFQRSHNWYALGGGVPFGTYDRGGYLPRGLSLAYNGTGKPEPVGHDKHSNCGDVHIHGNVYVKSEREFREMVIAATAEAKRRGRI